MASGNKKKPGDGIPEAPSLTETPTGIAYRGEETVAGLGQELVDAYTVTASRQNLAEQEDKKQADLFAGDVRGDIEETTGLIDVASGEVEKDRQRFRTEIEGARGRIEGIPDEITNEFDRLRDEFGAEADVSFDRIDTQREAALGKAEEGRSAAMQAAVEGIQGNVNNQVAQINANPDLTQSQKQSMISQVKLAGASSMAPAIGQTVLAFNQLSADIATKFGGITGQIESTVLGAKAQLTGLQGQAFSAAQVAVGQMSNQLLEIEANASASFASSQSQLLATRTQATMTGNDILLRTLPEQSTPYLDLTGAATAAYTIGSDVVSRDFVMRLQTASMEITKEMVASMRGSPIENLLEVVLGAVL
jgi:hypothetical protein